MCKVGTSLKQPTFWPQRALTALVSITNSIGILCVEVYLINAGICTFILQRSFWPRPQPRPVRRRSQQMGCPTLWTQGWLGKPWILHWTPTTGGQAVQHLGGNCTQYWVLYCRSFSLHEFADDYAFEKHTSQIFSPFHPCHMRLYVLYAQ